MDSIAGNDSVDGDNLTDPPPREKATNGFRESFSPSETIRAQRTLVLLEFRSLNDCFSSENLGWLYAL